jgi:PadR family transcriptional regulator PadR
MRNRPEIPPGTLYMLILKSLARTGAMHGYGIAHHIQQISDDVLQVEEGSLYPALQRMLLKGWVAAEWKQSENNRRARYYHLTREGRKQMTREVGEFERVIAAIARVIEPA